MTLCLERAPMVKVEVERLTTDDKRGLVQYGNQGLHPVHTRTESTNKDKRARGIREDQNLERQ